MDNTSYFYKFIEPISKELAYVARELENSIFTSPRTMLTHARIFIENILELVIQQEKLSIEPRITLKDRIDLLNENGVLVSEIRDALHHVRQLGNQAAHDPRMFRYSEALLSWESIYKIVKWYVEVYGPVNSSVPSYQDPKPNNVDRYDISELETRLKSLEELLIAAMASKPKEELASEEEVAVASEITIAGEPKSPGYTIIRTLKYKNRSLDVPHFLRDAFLLPQRFSKSETFLVRLGAEQQARIMSELPNNLDGLHKHVKRYSEKNDEIFFEELSLFIDEEKKRKRLILERPGELFFFYKENYIIVTEEISRIPLTNDYFSGIPSLLKQLNGDEKQTVGQLPQELVILAKYTNVGIGTVEKLFEQLKKLQKKTNVL